MDDPVIVDIEVEARKLRDAIYGPCREETWDMVKKNWIEEIRWLREHAPVKPDPQQDS